MTPLSQWRDNEPLLTTKILVTELLIVLKHLETNFRVLRVKLADKFLIIGVDRRRTAHVDVSEDTIDALNIKFHAELPTKVGDFVNVFTPQLGRKVAMVDEDCNECDHGTSHINAEPLLEHLSKNKSFLNHSLLYFINLVARVLAWVGQVAITSTHEPIVDWDVEAWFILLFLLLPLFMSECASCGFHLLLTLFTLFFWIFLLLLLLFKLLLSFDFYLLLHGSQMPLFIAEMDTSIFIRLVSHLIITIHTLLLPLAVLGDLNLTFFSAIEDGNHLAREPDLLGQVRALRWPRAQPFAKVGAAYFTLVTMLGRHELVEITVHFRHLDDIFVHLIVGHKDLLT